MIVRGKNDAGISTWLNLSGIVNDEIESPGVNWDLKTPASFIAKKLGVEAMRNLHEAKLWIDILLFISAWTLFISCWYLIAILDFGWYYFPLAIFQAIIITNFFYSIRHDSLMHRQIGGNKLTYVFGIIVSLPMMTSYVRFLRHEDHHVHIGYDLFEEHIAEIDSKWKRWLCLTMLGLLILGSGKLKSKDTTYTNQKWVKPKIVSVATKREMIFHSLWIIGIITAAIFWPYAVLMGYVFPFIILGPILFSIKYCCQHSESNPDNPFHTSVFFKSNLLLRIIYFNSIGEMHLIHHIFPRIPVWKMNKASKLISPILKEQQVPERKFWEVINGYYFKGKTYRTLWK